VLNGIALCPGCHDLKIDSAEQSPIWFMFEWLTKNRPKLIDYILEMRNGKVKTSAEWYLEIIEKLSNPIELTEEQKDTLNYPTSFPRS